MTDRCKAQIIWPSVSGLPEDVFINTLHFVTDINNDIVGADIVDRLDGAFNLIHGTAALSSYLGNTVSSATDAIKVRLYNELDDSLPPFYEGSFTRAASSTSTDEPWEVCACLSFKNLSVTTVPERNRRGRIFWGPVNRDVLVEAFGDINVKAEFAADALAAMQYLHDANDANALWTVYSKVQAEGYVVEAGWVDNTLDTQRRRGPRPTSRQTATF